MINVQDGFIDVETNRLDMKIAPNNIFYTLQKFESNNPSIDKLLQNFSADLDNYNSYGSNKRLQPFNHINSINLSELNQIADDTYFPDFSNPPISSYIEHHQDNISGYSQQTNNITNSPNYIVSNSSNRTYLANNTGNNSPNSTSYMFNSEVNTTNPTKLTSRSSHNSMNYADLNRIFHYQSLYERYLTTPFGADDLNNDNFYIDKLDNLHPELSKVVPSLNLYLEKLDDTLNNLFTILKWFNDTMRCKNYTSEANSLIHIQSNNLRMIFNNAISKLELLNIPQTYEKICNDSTTASSASTHSPNLSISYPDEFYQINGGLNTLNLNNQDDHHTNMDMKPTKNDQSIEQKRSFKHTFPKEWLDYDFPSIQSHDKPAQLKFLASANVVGRLFDYNGEHIRVIQNKFNVKISTSGNRIFYPGTGKQVLLIEGRLVHIMYAIRTVFFMMIPDILDVSKLPDYFNADSIKFEISLVIPSSTSNKILSYRGAYIQKVQQQTNARIHVTCMRFEMGEIQERLACITGSQTEVERSIELISLLIQEDQNKENYDFLKYPLYTKAHVN